MPAPAEPEDWTDRTWLFSRRKDDEFENMAMIITGKRSDGVTIMDLRHTYTRYEYNHLCVILGVKDRFHLFGYKWEPIKDRIERNKKIRERKRTQRR